MLDFEEFSTGHKDLLSSKYYSSVNVSPSTSNMDMLLTTGDSFQDMLDLDIKSEIDTVLGFNNDFANLNFNFHDAPPLDLDDNPSELNMWFTGSNHSNSNFNIDFIGSEAAAMMVNPNSVMPLALVTVPPKSPITNKSPSPVQKSLTFPSVIKVSDVAEIKKPLGKTIKVSSPLNNKIVRTPEIKTNNSLLNIKQAIQKQISSGNFNGISNVKVLSNNRKQQFNNNRHFGDEIKAFPKPAYSYSCLIAMALKNSRNGSLPVSEIYNFMCEHFPYFKTAPNGWKNSVRHNLSLNKCFEKIEKPAVSGAQRKGCLWAMNPAKISKMDDEVQKWSRKDPTAIRKAMINPEHLEALERGELKYTCRLRSEDDVDIDEDPGTEEEEDGSASDVEGSDVEVEETLELDADFINVSTVDEDAFDLEEVTETFYSVETSPTIKIEMEVVEEELLESSYTSSRKRSRGILELDDSFSGSRLYHLQPPTRRKTAYLIKNE